MLITIAQVKETSFSVPLTRIISDPASIYFSESAIAALAPTDGKGLKVENPVIITNIDSLDFARFLEVVYPMFVSSPEPLMHATTES